MAFGFRRTPFKWNFKCVNPADFELVIHLEARNKMIKDLFEKAKIAMARKKGINVKGNPDIIDRFDVEPRFLKLIDTGIGKELKIVSREVGADGIMIQTSKVAHAWFERCKHDSELWDVFVRITGTYFRRKD